VPDTPRTWRPALLSVSLILGLTACGGITTPTISSSVDGDWQLVSAQVDGEPLELSASHRVTLSIDGDEVGGISGCNHYGGEIRIEGQRVSIGQLGGTDMACSPPEVMELEIAYLTALQRVDQVSGGNALVLTGTDAELRYEQVPPVPTADLVGTEWVLDSIASDTGPDAAVSSTVGEPATLLLNEDGSLLASTGCRDVTGSYTTVGDEIVVTEMSADGDCQPEVEAQDDHVVSVLGDGFRVSIDGQHLTVTSRDGAGSVYVAER
jgi:heat shock protein HslJ